MNVESEILAVSAAWDSALISNVPEDVARYMAEEWVYVDPTGPVPKADVIGWIATGRLAHHSMVTVGQHQIAVHRDVVIVTARKASTGTWEGVEYAADEWISEVFVRRDGQWRSVLSHKRPVE